MIDTFRIRRAFDRAAAGFDARDFLHREIRERLLERLPGIVTKPVWIADLGAGTGGAAPFLKSRFPAAGLLSIDSSRAMLEAGEASKLSVCADVTNLPLADGCIDLAVSNLMLHHCPDPSATLAEIRRVLSDCGLLLMTTFGRTSFIELGRAWATADSFTHIAPFFDLQNLGSLLTTNGFTEPVLDYQTLTVTYDSLTQMMQDLRDAGSTNATGDRNRGLTGRHTWERLTAAYDQLRGPDGKLPVTLQVIFAIAWAGSQKGAGNEVEISVDSIHRVQHSKR